MDAYTEVGGRATQDAKAEGGGRERPEHILERIFERLESSTEIRLHVVSEYLVEVWCRRRDSNSHIVTYTRF